VSKKEVVSDVQLLLVNEHWVEGPEGPELHLHVRTRLLEEIAEELGRGAEVRTEAKQRLTERVRHYVQRRYPNAPIRTVKVFLGGMLLANVTVGALAATPAEAAKATAVQETKVQVIVNGQSAAELRPVLKDGTTMVQARELASVLGAQYEYQASATRGVITKNGNRLSFVSGDTRATVNGKTVTTVAPMIRDNRLYVPLRTVSEALQAKVAYDKHRTAVVMSTESSIVVPVQAGDSLFKIAQRYKTSVNALQALNNLEGPVIHPGGELLVPIASTSYIVKAGDSLFKVAQKHDADVASIKQLNALTSDVVQPGQKLYVPKETLPAPATSTDARASVLKVPEAPVSLPSTSVPIHELPADQKAVAVLQQPTLHFPVPALGKKRFDDTFGGVRGWTPKGQQKRSHEGIDLFAPEGTPIVSVGDGTVINYGWNPYGGWRVTIRLDNAPYAVYYAHLSKYAPTISQGKRVQAGQVIGYVGSTGYGPEGTKGKFTPHLHLGIYDVTKGWKAINPYPHLIYWQNRL